MRKLFKSRRSLDRESGQALPIVGFLVGSMALVSVLVVHVGGAANVAARAQTAADASALAAVQGGRPAATEAADANGARLTQFEHQGDTFFVEVSVGDRTARARAKLSGGLEDASR